MRAIAVASLLFAASVSRAQAPATPEARARAHYEKGLVHYNLSEWDAAISEFERAYEISRAHGLLFNIGQAARLKGDKQRALDSYRAYLRMEIAANNRPEVEVHIAALEKALAAEAEQRRRQQTPEPRPPPPAAPPPKAADKSRVMRVDANVMRVEVKGKQGNRVMTWAGLALAGAGVVAIGVGTYYVIESRQKWDEVQKINDRGLQWGDHEQGLWNDAEDQEKLAKVLLPIGAACVVTGGILYWFGAHAEGSSLFSVAPTRGGGLVAFGSDF